MVKRTPRRILIDFDRVIHKYSQGWKDGTIYDSPVEGAIDSIKKLQEAGFEIIVFTAKSSLGLKRNRWISQWLKARGLNLKVTWIKLPAVAVIDDRAIRFTNWTDILHYFI